MIIKKVILIIILNKIIIKISLRILIMIINFNKLQYKIMINNNCLIIREKDRCHEANMQR